MGKFLYPLLFVALAAPALADDGAEVWSFGGDTYAAGRTVATLVLTDLAANGTVCLYTHRTVHLVADVQGWWPST